MKLLRKIGFPISLVYGLVVYIRNVLFDKGIFKSVSYSTPTICVGNLSVGGTGKTPMIE
ncbi:MAG: tetraacyldisaccharide 4'-kinase, partial [Flavobacteriales bacterium]